MTPPPWPVGKLVPEANASAERRAELIAELEALPGKVVAALSNLPASRLEAKYKNWTVRQIVHHLADSHVNCFVRLRLALTEPEPSIKPYDESKWSDLPDNKTMDLAPSLAILTAIHVRIVAVLKTMTAEQFDRSYYHPEYKKTVTLTEMLGVYAHHGRHHLAQIDWVKANR